MCCFISFRKPRISRPLANWSRAILSEWVSGWVGGWVSEWVSKWVRDRFFVLIKTVTIGEIVTGGETQCKTGLSYNIRIWKTFKRNSHKEELKHSKSYIMELYYRSMVIYSSSVLKIQQCFLWVILGIFCFSM